MPSNVAYATSESSARSLALAATKIARCAAGNAAQAILPTVDGVVPFYILPEPRRFSLAATFTF